MQVDKRFEAMQRIYVPFYLYVMIGRFDLLAFKIMPCRTLEELLQWVCLVRAITMGMPCSAVH